LASDHKDSNMDRIDPLAYAIGAREIALVFSGSSPECAAEAAARMREADALLIATPTTDSAGLAWKLDYVWQHFTTECELFGPLAEELGSCVQDASRAQPDFAHLAAAISVVEHRMIQRGGEGFYLELLHSAGRDAIRIHCTLLTN
jgi:hypothetical protein